MFLSNFSYIIGLSISLLSTNHLPAVLLCRTHKVENVENIMFSSLSMFCYFTSKLPIFFSQQKLMSPLTAKSVLQRYEKCPKLKLRALYIDDAVGVKHGFEGN